MTLDFTKLCTKIPHDLLMKALNEIFDFGLNGKRSDAEYVNEFGDFWRNHSNVRAHGKRCIKRALTFTIHFFLLIMVFDEQYVFQ